MRLYTLTITEPKRVGRRKNRKHTAIVMAHNADEVLAIFKASDSVWDTPDASYSVEERGSPVVMLKTFETC